MIRWMGSARNENGEDEAKSLLQKELNFDSFTSGQRPEPSVRLDIKSSLSAEPQPSPFLEAANRSDITSLVPSVDYRGDITHSFSVNEFIEKSEDCTLALRDMAATRLGVFTISDVDAARIFKYRRMLTRGSDKREELDWKEKWRTEIKKENRGWFGEPATELDAWSEKVTVGAYAVNIKRVAERKGGALLSMLLARTAAGATSRHVWEFPVVRALINYHWKTWAHSFLFFQLALFAAWTGLLILYLLFYIESDVQKALDGDADYSSVHAISYLINVLLFVIMCPFALLEALTLWRQGYAWLQFRNLVDISVCMLQTLFFFCHVLKFGVGEEWYSVLLALFTVIMIAKLQDYGRVLGLGTSFVETFLAVIYEVRYFIVFIVFAIGTTGLCLATLYKGDKGFEVEHGHQEFKSVLNSMVTTVAVLFGQFEVDYVFHADYPWIKSLFFFGFQMFMAVTIMNMLIAAMTQAYSTYSEDQNIRYNIGRAYVIDDLQVLKIPFFSPKIQDYIHFLIVEESRKNSEHFPLQHTTSMTLSLGDLQREVSKISRNLQKIMSSLDVNQLETGQSST